MLSDIITQALQGVLDEASKKEPKKDEFGRRVLKLPLFYGVLGIFCDLIAVVILVYPLLGQVKEGDGLGWFICFLIAAGFGSALTLAGFVLQIRVSEYDIVQRTVLGRYKSIYWPEVTKVKFNLISQQLTITDGKVKIRCHQHLVGFPTLLHMIYDKRNIKVGNPDRGPYRTLRASRKKN